MLHLFIPALSLSFAAGCGIAYGIPVQIETLAMLITAATGMLFLVRGNAAAVLLCVSFIALLFGFMRVMYAEQRHGTGWDRFYETTVTVTGTVRGDIEHTNANSRYTVGAARVTDDTGAVFRPHGKILVYEPYPTACVSGETVTAVMSPGEPEDFITEANRVFRYGEHLRQQGVYAVAFTRESVCTGHADSRPVFPTLRKKFMEAVHTVLPMREGSLLGGLLLGLRGSLPQELMDIFRVTGLIHIIVLSGYNITVVAEAVRRIFSRAPRKVSLGISLVTIILFVLLAGAQTAAVRAGGMATVALIARAWYREYDGLRILLLVGALMALYNPDQVLFSTSFHMSFLATLGLLLFSPILERRLTFVPDAFQIRNITAATLSTQLFLLPYLMYSIGEVSLVGIIANILVLPIVPIAMACGAALILITLTAPFIAPVAAPFAYLPLAAIIFLADLLAVPHAAAPLPFLSAPLMLAAVIVLSYLGIRYGKPRDPPPDIPEGE